MNRRATRPQESGYALLLLLLIAAIIAINLYSELPRVAFQAQRAKEQMLMERGEQYKRAIGLFLRTNKNTRWPASIEELENFNNHRSLRKRYLDPMTGKDDWRIIHIANGILTDSLTNKKKDDQQDHLSKNGSVMEVAGLAGLDATGQPGVNAVNRRRVSEGGTQLGPDGQPLPNGGGAPLPGALPPFPGAPGVTAPTGATAPIGVAGGPNGMTGPASIAGFLGIPVVRPGASGSTGATGSSAPPVDYGLGNGIAAVGGGPPVQNNVPGALPGNLSGGFNGAPGATGIFGQQNGGGGIFAAAGAPGAAGTPQNGMNISPQAQAAAASLIQGLLTQPRPGGMAGLPQAGAAQAGMMGNGIAGVASKAEADSIMVYTDQTNYKEWEFIYDPAKFAAPPNPNTASAPGGVPVSQLASGNNSTGPGVLNQNGTSVSNIASGAFGAAGATSSSGAAVGAGIGAGIGANNPGARTGVFATSLGAPGGATPGPGGVPNSTGAPGTGTPTGSSAFGTAGLPDIRPGKAW